MRQFFVRLLPFVCFIPFVRMYVYTSYTFRTLIKKGDGKMGDFLVWFVISFGLIMLFLWLSTFLTGYYDD